MEAAVKELIKESIAKKLENSGLDLLTVDVTSTRLVTAVMALAYNDRDVKAAAQDIYEIPTQSFGDNIDVIEELFAGINTKMSKEIEAFMAYISSPEDENVLNKIQTILK